MFYKELSRFFLTDIFNVSYGNKLDFCNLEETDNNDIDGVAFVTRTANNNGIGAFVKRIEIPPYPKNSITVALGGSLGATFVQPTPFYTSQNVAVLCDRQKPLTINQKLFIATLIKKEASVSYVAFGRELNKHIKKDFSILLPITKTGKPDWEWIERYMQSFNLCLPFSRNLSKNSKIDITKWKQFKISDFLELTTGKVNKACELPEGDDIYYLGAKKDSNGIMCKVKKIDKLVSNGNCIIFICDGQGAIGYNNYMPNDFIGTVNLSLGYSKYLNKYTGLFLVTILDKERFRFSFGRKRKATLKDTLIRLPATSNGDPDWNYMEEYIKSLPYGDCI